ncbi:lysozyme 1B-like [Eupeodes corollae]|uniref:lysozyme 1B-like n=1 Tax=Eupeodes corollae TaxID=290404 RepID=UPI0024920B28|nr:lysozyme 1B-like [Eupeodes corollae]
MFKLKFVLALFSIIAIVCIEKTQGKIFKKCELARAMYRLGVPKSELRDWVCLAKGESSYNTKAINHSNSDGSSDWGIFQVNDRYWCKPSDRRQQSENICKVSCNDLMQDNITKAVKCARVIKKEQGFEAWVAWTGKCRTYKPSIKECF